MPATMARLTILLAALLAQGWAGYHRDMKTSCYRFPLNAGQTSCNPDYSVCIPDCVEKEGIWCKVPVPHGGSCRCKCAYEAVTGPDGSITCKVIQGLSQDQASLQAAERRQKTTGMCEDDEDMPEQPGQAAGNTSAVGVTLGIAGKAGPNVSADPVSADIPDGVTEEVATGAASQEEADAAADAAAEAYLSAHMAVKQGLQDGAAAEDGACVCTTDFDPVCGGDGKTYINACKADCNAVTVLAKGPCPEATTSEADAELTPGEQVVDEEEDCVCPTVLTPVCGANGKTYHNECIAGCMKVEVARTGECGAKKKTEKVEAPAGVPFQDVEAESATTPDSSLNEWGDLASEEDATTSEAEKRATQPTTEAVGPNPTSEAATTSALATTVAQEPEVAKAPPKACCLAMTKECLACKAGVSVKDFCTENQGRYQCPDSSTKAPGDRKTAQTTTDSPESEVTKPPPKACCLAMTKECLACKAGVSVKDFCAENEGRYECPGSSTKAPPDSESALTTTAAPKSQATKAPSKACCKAMTKECLACSEGVSVKDFCLKNEGRYRCPDSSTKAPREGKSAASTTASPEPEVTKAPPKACCKAMTKECLACEKGVSVKDFCLENEGKYKCPKRSTTKPRASKTSPSTTAALEPKVTKAPAKSCCKALTKDCLACSRGISVKEFCSMYEGMYRCPKAVPADTTTLSEGKAADEKSSDDLVQTEAKSRSALDDAQAEMSGRCCTDMEDKRCVACVNLISEEELCSMFPAKYGCGGGLASKAVTLVDSRSGISPADFGNSSGLGGRGGPAMLYAALGVALLAASLSVAALAYLRSARGFRRLPTAAGSPRALAAEAQGLIMHISAEGESSSEV